MIWIDKRTGILSDTSIIKFNDDGSVEFFMAKGWKKMKKHKYSSKETAIAIWESLDKLLIKEKKKK